MRKPIELLGAGLDDVDVLAADGVTDFDDGFAVCRVKDGATCILHSEPTAKIYYNAYNSIDKT